MSVKIHNLNYRLQTIKLLRFFFSEYKIFVLSGFFGLWYLVFIIGKEELYLIYNFGITPNRNTWNWKFKKNYPYAPGVNKLYPPCTNVQCCQNERARFGIVLVQLTEIMAIKSKLNLEVNIIFSCVNYAKLLKYFQYVTPVIPIYCILNWNTNYLPTIKQTEYNFSSHLVNSFPHGKPRKSNDTTIL